MLTVKMSDFTDKCIFKSDIFNKSIQFNTTKQSQLFSDKNMELGTSFVGNKTNPGGFTSLPRRSSANSQFSQFKVPNLNDLPVKKAAVNSIKSPRRRVQTGRVKNDLKGQQSKMSLIPRPSFINSGKSLHGSRCTQLNARKELLKRMVYLAECSLKENREIKPATPVKLLAVLTPKKTPRSGGYFILPEFKKKEIPKLEDIRSPIDDLVKKEMFGYSAKPTPRSEKKAEMSCIKPNEGGNSILPGTPKEKLVAEVKNSLDAGTRFYAILKHCKNYNSEVKKIHERIKVLDESFELKLKTLPDYRVYNDFCSYQLKKEELYKKLQTLESELRIFVSTHTKVGSKLTAYMKLKQEFFQKQLNLHKDFEQIVNTACEKYEEKDNKEIAQNENKSKAETPKLRRSLRLSKIKKSKIDEKTPMTRRLKKFNSKSKGIQKSGKLRSP